MTDFSLSGATLAFVRDLCESYKSGAFGVAVVLVLQPAFSFVRDHMVWLVLAG